MGSQLELFVEKLELFKTLNPDVIYSERKTLLKLANEVSYPEFGEFVEKTINLYLNSTFKQNERAIIDDYSSMIERGTQRLIESGEIVAPEQKTVETGAIISRNYSETQWLTVLCHTDVPASLNQAIEAVERRKRMVSSILEYLFEIFHTLDIEQAFSWQKQFLAENSQPDPDIIRDLLRAWRKLDCLVPAELLDHALSWCENESVKRLWPSIIKEADRVLQTQALKRLPLENYQKNSAVASLLRIMPVRNDKVATRWIRRALNKLTEDVLFFTELERKYHDENEESYQLAAFRTLTNLKAVFEPFMIMSHLLLDGIGGAEKIAMALMGFSEEHHAAWDKTLHGLSAETIRRFFLNDLKSGQTPLKTIEKLCFGNDALYRRILSEMDFKTKQFESINQREIAEDILAYNYASFRAEKLLREELSRRYRRFMRMVHEDSLRRFLKPEHLEETVSSVLVTEYAVSASQARKFVAVLQNEEIPAEEVFAAKEEFIAVFHKRRRLVIRRIIHENAQN